MTMTFETVELIVNCSRTFNQVVSGYHLFPESKYLFSPELSKRLFLFSRMVVSMAAASSLITTGLLSVPSLHLNDQANHVRFGSIPTNTLLTQNYKALARNSTRRSRHLSAVSKVSAGEETIVKGSGAAKSGNDIGILSIHHVGLLCENLERSLEFYQNLLGLEINEARPNDKLPYKGVWFWVGSEMIHLMELPNPDPLTGRPEHGGRDRHTCIAIRDVSKLKAVFDKAGIPYTLSKSGRPAIFARDPDANALEFTQVDN